MNEMKSLSSTRSSRFRSITLRHLRASSSVKKTSTLVERSIISSSEKIPSSLVFTIWNTCTRVKFSRMMFFPI